MGVYKWVVLFIDEANVFINKLRYYHMRHVVYK